MPASLLPARDLRPDDVVIGAFSRRRVEHVAIDADGTVAVRFRKQAARTLYELDDPVEVERTTR